MKKWCPICIAVVVAWVLALILKFSGFKVDELLIAMLMGGSIGAVATKYGSDLIWKTAFVVVGFLATWFLFKDQIIWAIVLYAGLAGLTLFNSKTINPKKGEQKSDRFDDCC